MKNTVFSIIFICSIFLTMTTGCERADIQKSSTNQDVVISLRDECEDCSVGCCCCSIEAFTPAMFSLTLCGTCDDGDMLCGPFSPPAPCSTFSGVVKTLSFTTGHTRDIFCIPEGGSFRIFNPGLVSVSFRFTCQPDVTPPTFINVTIPANQARFFHNDGSCVAEGCN